MVKAVDILIDWFIQKIISMPVKKEGGRPKSAFKIKTKKPKPRDPDSSEDNPLIVGMTGEGIARYIMYVDGIWYETDGLGNGVIR